MLLVRLGLGLGLFVALFFILSCRHGGILNPRLLNDLRMLRKVCWHFQREGGKRNDETCKNAVCVAGIWRVGG